MDRGSIIMTFLQVCHILGKVSCKVEHRSHDIADEYTFWPPLSRLCEDKRSQFVPYDFVSHNSPDSQCRNLVPGLAKMQHGVNRHYFASSSSDHHPVYEQIFTFTCFDSLDTTLRYFQNYTVPSEVKYIRSKPSSTYERNIITTQSLRTAFLDDLQLKKPRNQYVLHLAELDLKINDNVRSAAYMSVNIHRYRAQIRNTLQVTDAIWVAYHNLPTTLQGNVQDYYRFLRTFGTDVLTNAVFGGQFFILIALSRNEDASSLSGTLNPQTTESFINDVLLTDEGQQIRHTIVVHGGHLERLHDVHSWISTVGQDPVPIDGKYMPIYALIEKNNITSRSSNMRTMVLYEEQINILKKFIFELKSMSVKNKLGSFLTRSITDEVDQVCVSSELMETISHGIFESNNIGFNSYGLNCTIKWYNSTYHYDIVSVRQYFLLPNICLSFSVPVKNGCDKVHYAMPPGVLCMVFFDEYRCNPYSRKRYVKNVADINREITSTKSIRFCTLAESETE